MSSGHTTTESRDQGSEQRRTEPERPCYFTVIRTVGGQEYSVALILKTRIEVKNLDIPSIVVLPRLKGIIFVESAFPFLVQNMITGIKHCKGVLRGKVPLEEILKVIFKPVEVPNVGDIVEIVSGPFKGYRGRVVDVDREQESVTIEILDAASPMPIVLRIKEVRIVERRQGESSG